MKPQTTTEQDSMYQEIQKELVDILTEISYTKGRSKKEAIISSLFYVNNELTQQEIQEFTKIYDTRKIPLNKKKGFSRGIISSIINDFVDQGYLNREFRKKGDFSRGGYKYYYSLKGSLRETLGIAVTRVNIFFAEINKKMIEIEKQLSNSTLKEKKGYKNLESFSKNMNQYLQANLKLMNQFKQPVKKNTADKV